MPEELKKHLLAKKYTTVSEYFNDTYLKRFIMHLHAHGFTAKKTPPCNDTEIGITKFKEGLCGEDGFKMRRCLLTDVSKVTGAKFPTEFKEYEAVKPKPGQKKKYSIDVKNALQTARTFMTRQTRKAKASKQSARPSPYSKRSITIKRNEQ
jgi:uncharacterized protein YihD (DUF1040 family)